MWVSLVRPFFLGKYSKKPNFGRYFTASALAQLLPTSQDSNLEDQVVTASTHHPTKAKERSLSLDVVKVVEVLDRLRFEPSPALSLLCQLKGSGFVPNARTYAAIVRALCLGGFWGKLDGVVSELIRKERHFGFGVVELFEALGEGDGSECSYVLARVSCSIVEAYSFSGMFDEAIDVVFRGKCRGFVACMSSCNFLMTKLLEFGKVDVAVAVYRHLAGIRLRPDCYTYSIVIKALCVKGSLEEAFAVFFGEMEEAGVSPDAFFYTTFIEGLCKNRRPDLGWEMLRICMRTKVRIDMFAFAVVIRGFCNEKKLEEAERVFLNLEKCGLQPDKYVYSALIYGFCRARYLSKALSFHDEMVTKGIKTNCVIVNSILQGFCEIGMGYEAVIQFGQFQKMGIYLDKVNYNSAMAALCKLGRVEEAVVLLFKMRSRGVVPDLVNYNTLISGFCHEGKLSDASSLVMEMKENGQQPDIVSYEILVDGFSRNGFVQNTIELLGFMKTQGLRPSTAMHNIVIRGFCIGSKVEEAEDFLNKLDEKCSDNYCALIKGCCEASCTEKAFNLFIRMAKQGRAVEKGSCSKLLHSLCAKGDTERADRLFWEMRDMGISPTIVMCSKLIGILCQDRDMKKARSVFDDMRRRGPSPNLIVYTIMIGGYCMLNHLKEADHLFTEMKKSGFELDIVTYTVWLDCCTKSDSVIMSEIHGQNIQRDVDFYTALIDRNCKIKNIEDATKLFDQMIATGLEPDIVAYTALLSGHTTLIDRNCKINNIEDATKLFDQMIATGLEPDKVAYKALLSGFYKAGDRRRAALLRKKMSEKGVRLTARSRSNCSTAFRRPGE